MRIAHIDCFSGISGNMLIGALLDLGADAEALRDELQKLTLGSYEITVETVRRGALAATHFGVTVPKTHGREQERRYRDIVDILSLSSLSERVRSIALDVFERVARAESRIHGVKLEDVAFHEIGAVDSIVDIVGTAITIEQLGIQLVTCSRVPLGHGTVRTRHGGLPLPAPATLEILRGVPVYSVACETELVTPTGAALIRALCGRFGPVDGMRIEQTGYGAGDDRKGYLPNVLRVVLGEEDRLYSVDEVRVIETNIDDMSPELYEHLIERLLAEGALDVSLSPLQMKKARPGVLLRVLAHDPDAQPLARVIFAESSAIGVRMHRAERWVLDRSDAYVSTPFGKVRVKVSRDAGGILNVHPEYEECRRLARENRVPLKRVHQAALAEAARLQEEQ